MGVKSSVLSETRLTRVTSTFASSISRCLISSVTGSVHLKSSAIKATFSQPIESKRSLANVTSESSRNVEFVGPTRNHGLYFS